jgi:hypothetical protein
MRVVAIALCVLLAASSFAAAEMIDNPQYQGWAKRNPGSSAMLKGKTVAMGHTMDMEMTQKLIEVTPEEVVIEASTVMTMLGNKLPAQTMKQNIPAKVEKDPSAEDPTQPKVEWKEGEEKVEVMGKSFTCKVYESSMKQGNSTMVAKVWSTEEVPGGMVKMQATVDGDMKSETTMELVSYEDK